MPQRCSSVQAPQLTPPRRSPRFLQPKNPPTLLKRTSRSNRIHPVSTSDSSLTSSAPRSGSGSRFSSKASLSDKSASGSGRASRFCRNRTSHKSASPIRITTRKSGGDCKENFLKGFGKIDVGSACCGRSGHGSRKTTRLGASLEGIKGLRRSTRSCKEVTPLTDVHAVCNGLDGFIHCNGESKRGLRKLNVAGTDNMAVRHLEVSPVTPVGVKKFRGVQENDTGPVASGSCGELSGNIEKRITRSCSRQVEAKVRYGNAEENKQKGSNLLKISERESRKRTDVQPGGQARGTSYAMRKESGSGSFRVLVCGLESSRCNSLSLRCTPKVRLGRQYKLKVNHEKNGEEDECGQLVGNPKRMGSRSASKHMKGQTDLCGQMVEGRSSHTSSRLVAGKTESVKSIKEKLENNGSLKCLISKPHKRITRSSPASFSINLEEEAGVREIDGRENNGYHIGGLDNGELGKVDCDALPRCSTLGGAERKIQHDISKEPELIGIKRKRNQTRLQGTDQGWTKEQEGALQRAYFSAKPSPHFWKKVSKLVPGKSAQECFDKVHSDNLTPLSIRPSRAKKWDSPDLSLSGCELFKCAEKRIKKTGKNKQKSHVTRRTMRHLMQKYCHVNQDSETDLFSVLEPMVNPSGETLQLNVGQSTPQQRFGSPGSLLRCRDRSSNHKERRSRYNGASGSPLTSPPVLKKVKNLALHEKYIDQLHTREAKRKVASARYLKSVHQKDGEANPAAMKDVVRAAKDALVSDARDVIQKFQHSQSNITEALSDSEEFFTNDDEAEEISL